MTIAIDFVTILLNYTFVFEIKKLLLWNERGMKWCQTFGWTQL